MVTILMMSAKMVTLGLLKIKLIWNNGYDVIFLSMAPSTIFYPVTQMIFYMGSSDPSLVTLAFLWEKLS